MDYVVTAEKPQDVFYDTKPKDSALTYTIDLSPWAEKYGNITSATWTVKSGTASISGQSLSTNVASALISFPELGMSLIQIKANTGSDVSITHLSVNVWDPETSLSDYGL